MSRPRSIGTQGGARRWSAAWRPLVVVTAAALVAAGCGSSSKPAASNSTAPAGSASGSSGSGNTASAPGITPTTITLAFLGPLTGPLAASFSTVPIGFNARIALQNAEGGVNGRQIKVVQADDQGNLAQSQLAVKTAVEQDHAFAIGTVSVFTFANEPYLLKAGVPIAGEPLDANEWAPPNNNMFPNTGSENTTCPGPVNLGTFLKSQGVTRLAVLGGPLPSEACTNHGAVASAKLAGIQVPYDNLTIPTTQEGNFQNIASQMKSDNVDGVYLDSAAAQGLAEVAAAEQAGITFKAILTTSQPSSKVLENPQANQAAKNMWAPIPETPAGINSPAVTKIANALSTYEHVTTPPERHEYEGWLAADILITGLQLAGKNPTRASFISALRADHNYTADGLEVGPVDFTQSFGTGAQSTGPAPGDCDYFVQYNGSQWVPQPKPICGGLVPGSGT
jgi:branched-chain amino acid transport system substrate-binding protein